MPSKHSKHTHAYLLSAPQKSLTDIERQLRFLLQTALKKNPCGRCGRPHSQFEAWAEGQGHPPALTIEDYPIDVSDRNYTCPTTNERIRYIVPMIGECMFYGIVHDEEASS